MKRKIFFSEFGRLILFVFGFLLLLIVLLFLNNKRPIYTDISQSLQHKFSEKETKLIQAVEYFSKIEKIEENFNKIFQSFILRSNSTYEFAFYVFHQNNLIHWTSNKIPIQDSEYKLLQSNKQLIRLLNGYYYLVSQQTGDFVVAGLMPVYYSFPYQNEYLKNGFATHFSQNQGVSLTTVPSEDMNIVNNQNEFLFSVKIMDDAHLTQIPFGFILAAFLAFMAALLVFVAKIIQKFIKNSVLFVVLLLVFVVLLRYLQIKYLFPKLIYQDILFTPLHYAWNAWFASLGDLIINVFMFFMLSLIVWVRFRNTVKFFTSKLKRIFFLFICGIILMALFAGLNILLETLIINSTLLLSFDDVLKLTSVDFAGFFVIILLVFSFVYSSYVLFLLLRKNLRFRKEIIFFFSFLVLSCGVLIIIYPAFIIPLILFLIFLISAVSIRKRYFLVSGVFGLLGILLFALSFSSVLNKFNSEKEKSFRKLYAVQLSNEQDPVGEYLFEEIAKKMLADTIFHQGLYVADDPSVFAEQYLKKNYLGGYFSKYYLQVTTCYPEQVLRIMPANIEAQCCDFFSSLKSDFGTPTMVANYWLIDDETGRPNYLFETEFLKKSQNQTDTMLMFVEMITIPKISRLGYPELLVDERVFKKTGRFEYAYAKYFKNELITQFGDYYYPLKDDASMQVNEIFFTEKNGYSHLLYPVDQKTTIHVSLPLKKPFEKAATFSYLLIVFVIFHYLLLALISVAIKVSFFQLSSFKTRLQSASVFLVILCFIVAGLITVNFFIRYHNNKNKEIIREKSYNLLVELDYNLFDYEYLKQEEKEMLSELMIRFSNVFYTDINLFSPSGQLLATSRPQVYQLGLTSTYMNPDALNNLKETHTPYLLQSEAIGTLNFTSTYLPFKNYKNEVIAYLNLPYFARENELRKEISTFLIAFMNFYVMLIALAIILALVVSNYITLPLRIIGEKLRALKPGQPNEKILWNKHDDIGVLVGEYNRMLDELSVSTQLLMKTERESAWREMAKQIAHEIKNPLTPMKLSLQNLQRAWNDKAPDYEERLKTTSQILIEQIEALSQIATEFSNFARMQEAQLHPVDIVPLINDAMHLYQSDMVYIEFSYQDSNSYIILADDTQIIQILNNILKNAVQSLNPKVKGQIFIQAEKSAGNVIVSIRDNGCGIPDTIRHKIFSPNFTAKSGGTGLGLAITKKITDNLGGSISFESDINKGSTFYLSFPEFTVSQNEQIGQ